MGREAGRALGLVNCGAGAIGRFPPWNELTEAKAGRSAWPSQSSALMCGPSSFSDRGEGRGPQAMVMGFQTSVRVPTTSLVGGLALGLGPAPLTASPLFSLQLPEGVGAALARCLPSPITAAPLPEEEPPEPTQKEAPGTGHYNPNIQRGAV